MTKCPTEGLALLSPASLLVSAQHVFALPFSSADNFQPAIRFFQLFPSSAPEIEW